MGTTTVDYTNIDDTLGGTDYQAALKLEFQHAEVDLVTKPDISGTETITGAWEFTSPIEIDTIGIGIAANAGVQAYILNNSTTMTPLRVQGIASTTADLFQVYDVGVKVLSVDNSGKATGTLCGTTFCMGDVTTPVGTYATALDISASESLATTQAILDHVVAALASIGLITEV